MLTNLLFERSDATEREVSLFFDFDIRLVGARDKAKVGGVSETREAAFDQTPGLGLGSGLVTEHLEHFKHARAVSGGENLCCSRMMDG